MSDTLPHTNIANDDSNSAWRRPSPTDDGGPLFKSDIDPIPFKAKSSTAIAGFVLGLLSILLVFLYSNPLILGVISILGLIFSWIGRRSPKSGLANAGFLLSGISLLLLVVFYVCMLSSAVTKH